MFSCSSDNCASLRFLVLSFLFLYYLNLSSRLEHPRRTSFQGFAPIGSQEHLHWSVTVILERPFLKLEMHSGLKCDLNFNLNTNISWS